MTSETILLGLGLIIGLGIFLQWLAKIIKIPGIILLLPAGILVGPVLGLVNPNEIFGVSLFPLVTIGVGLLLFKGGFELKIDKIQPDARKTVGRLISVGVIITFLAGALAAFYIFKIPTILAFLLAAILVVSGPTVVGPVLNIARPKPPVGHILLWEGITIDPIGASLGVAIISFITSQNPNPFYDMFLTIIIGIVIGAFTAILYVLSEHSGRIPPNLNPLVALMFAIMAIVSAEMIFSEAGLFAALTMGFLMGNQKITPTIGVYKFNRTIEPLIIGMLFIMLASLVDLQALRKFIVPALLMVAIYIFIVRPLVSYISTIRLGYNFSQRAFIGAMAPRGIVAASTSSLFAINLNNAGVSFPQLVPVVFTVIIATVAIYGLSAPVLSRKLDISMPDRNAVVLVGEQTWLLKLGQLLNHAGTSVLLLTSSKNSQLSGLREDIPFSIYSGPIAELDDEDIFDETHEFKSSVKWVINATTDLNKVKIIEEVFIPEIGHKNIIIFGRTRGRQDNEIHGGVKAIDALFRTPFGLFGKDVDDLLDILDSGGNFELIKLDPELIQNGLSQSKKPFLRIRKDGSLAVPGNLKDIKEGESLILITSKN